MCCRPKSSTIALMLTAVEWAADQGRGHVPLRMAELEQDSASMAPSAGRKGERKVPHSSITP